MAHYCSIQFEAKLSEIGAEVLSYLSNLDNFCKFNNLSFDGIKYLLDAAKYFPQYPFLEACYNRYSNRDICWDFSGVSQENATWVVDIEQKIKFQEDIYYFLLSYMISEEVKFIYASEHCDWKKDVTILDPINPMIDWDRKFGDPTGIEI